MNAPQKSFTHKCPRCGEYISFSTLGRLNTAIRNKSRCHQCSGLRISKVAETKAVELHDQGHTNRKIAEELSTSHATIKRLLALHGRASAPIVSRRKFDPVQQNGKRVCTLCGVPLSLNSFSSHSYACRLCIRTRRKARASRDIHSFLVAAWPRVSGKARRNNIPVDLTIDYIEGLFEGQRGLCFYTDTPLQFVVGEKRSPDALSFDKIIPKLGYVKGNVVLCTRRANVVKNDLTLEQMREWLPGWYQRLVRFM